MCGIFCLLQRNVDASDYKYDLDSKIFSMLTRRGPDIFHSSHNVINDTYVYMFGATLWTQGCRAYQQPQENHHGALLFNGDVYKRNVDTKENDCEDILKQMTDNDTHNEDIEVIKKLIGPFALIYLNKKSKKIYFSRDKYGRKSLLIYKNDKQVIISSVLGKEYEGTVELPAKSIYCLDLETWKIIEHPWVEDSIEQHLPGLQVLFDSLQIQNNDLDKFTPSTMSPEISDMYSDIEKIASQLDLKNKKKLLEKLLNIQFFKERVKNLIELLSQSVKIRLLTQPPYCKMCIRNKIECKNHCRVSILFSGGLDCTILAALAHHYTPVYEPIGLLNVAFENNNCKDYNVPDRLTSLNSLHELEKVFPERKWNLIQINVTTEELRKKQFEIISDLVFPLQTILDESLGSALWFAARGKTDGYESMSRVILMGMGADELFGGYTRHRNAYKRGGWAALERELELDWKRLPSRNLARDDRIVSHHGCQPRMPYLDENFLNYVLKLKPWERCFPSSFCEMGIGDKLLLRLVAMKLGLANTATLPKRAIQFGSRIANKNENANDISPRLKIMK